MNIDVRFMFLSPWYGNEFVSLSLERNLHKLLQVITLRCKIFYGSFPSVCVSYLRKKLE